MFPVSKGETDAIEKWSEEHDCKTRSVAECGAIGGRLTYCFTPTGLGIITVVKCACGGQVDVTEYENW